MIKVLRCHVNSYNVKLLIYRNGIKIRRLRGISSTKVCMDKVPWG